MPPSTTQIPAYELWAVNMPHEDVGGTSGPWPALMVKDLPEVKSSIVVPLTSNLGRLAFPLTVKIEATTLNRLTVTSVALVFQLRHIRRDALGSRIGPLAGHDRIRVHDMMGDMLGFDV